MQKDFNDDDYITSRAVNIPKKQIEFVEQTYGVKLVPDEEFITLLSLDETLKRYRKTYKQDPDLIQLAEHPEYYYKHMVLNMNFMGMEIPGSYNKPCWFRFRKSF